MQEHVITAKESTEPFPTAEFDGLLGLGFSGLTSPQDLSPAILTSIYGEEDWEVPADNEDDDERSPPEDRVRTLTVDAHP